MMGSPGGRRLIGRSQAGRTAHGGASGTIVDRIARSDLPGEKRFPVRRVAGPTDVPRALGGRARMAGEIRRGIGRSLGMARSSLQVTSASGADIRFVPSRGRRAFSRAAAQPRRSLLVVAARNAAFVPGPR